METRPEYTRNQLKVLWYIKRHQPLRAAHEGPTASLISQIGSDLDLRNNLVSVILSELEKMCLVIRHYAKPRGAKKLGFNPIMYIEMVDPAMWLPPLPEPPPKVIMANENEQMEHQYPVRNTHQEPAPEQIILALLERNEELRKELAQMQEQVDKLHDIVMRQEQEVTTAKKQAAVLASVPKFDHLTNRLQDALGAEAWESLKNDR